MADQAKDTVRIRVTRVLSGTSDRADVPAILSDLRSRKGVPTDVRDLGDLAAHRLDRNRGKALVVAAQLIGSFDAYPKADFSLMQRQSPRSKRDRLRLGRGEVWIDVLGDVGY